MLEEHRYALLLDSFDQYVIEFGPGYLPGPTRPCGELLREVVFADFTATQEYGTVLYLVALRLNPFE